MVEHIPIAPPTVSQLLSLAFVCAFTEMVTWVAIILISDRKVPSFEFVFARFEHALNSVTRRRSLVLAGIFLAVFVGRLAMLPVWPVPVPKIQDEFSQLLSADTFASGRLTNPTHPMWFYFETFFVNQSPTYHSMYPPATGLIMAVSQVLTGQPWFGMLFAFAAAAASMCWMLQGWMPQRWGPWAALVFILLVARAQLTENYLGEGIFVLGGTLILGAIPRMVRKCTIGASLCLAIGIALLATTRPFEGAFLVAGIGLGGFYWAWKMGVEKATLVKKVVLPVSLVLIPIFAAIGYLNWRTTGSVWLAPYQLNLAQQHLARPFLWEKLSDPPKYDHMEMASFFEHWELAWWKSTHEFPRGTLLLLTDKASITYAMILWPLGILVATGSLQLLKSKTRRFLPLAFGFFLAALGLEAYELQPRYTEPAWGLAILLAVYGLRYIGAWRRSTGQGRRIARAAAIVIPAALLLIDGFTYLAGHASRSESWYAARQQLSVALESVPGRQLVLVRYSPSHIPQEEWVYNRADIDRAKTVWARDDADHGAADLLRYFSDREVWVLEPDGKFPILTLNSADRTAPADSEVGPFRIFCGEPRCEDLKRSLTLALEGGSKISMAEGIKQIAKPAS